MFRLACPFILDDNMIMFDPVLLRGNNFVDTTSFLYHSLALTPFLNGQTFVWLVCCSLPFCTKLYSVLLAMEEAYMLTPDHCSGGPLLGNRSSIGEQAALYLEVQAIPGHRGPFKS